MLSILLSLYLAVTPLPIDISVKPFCFEPCDMKVTVRIPQHPLNRKWVIELYLGERDLLIQSSTRELEGDRAPTVQPDIWFRGLSRGDYQVTATLYRATVPPEAGKQARKVTVN